MNGTGANTKLLKDRKGLTLPHRPATVGVAQFSAINFDLNATLDKLEKIVKEAASKGVQLLVFPEAFVSGYPYGADPEIAFGNTSSAGRKLFELFHNSAVEIPGPAITRLGKIAKENNIFLVVTVVEKALSTLYCTTVFVKEDGTYLGKHRKILIFSWEKLMWGEGDGSTLPVFDSPVGKVGAVICGESYNPLLRAAMYSKGIEIYCAPTADMRDTWKDSMRHIAMEGRCFVLSSNTFCRRKDYPVDAEFPNVIPESEGDTIMSPGGSLIVSPLGEVLAGPNFESEGLLIAKIDLNDVVRSRWEMNSVGHFHRPDIFTLYINEKPNPGFVITDGMRQLKMKQNDFDSQAEGQECEAN